MDIFRIIKQGLTVSAAVVIAAAVSSCGDKSRYNSKVHINEALRYMNNKYHAEFTLVEENPAADNEDSSDEGYVDIFVSCKQMEGIRIRVGSSDGKTFFDDLVPKKYEHQAYSDMKVLAGTVYTGEKPKVNFEADTDYDLSQKTMPADMTYEDFMLSGALGQVDIYTEDSDAPLEDYRVLADRLAANNMNCQPSVYYFTDNSYENITADAPAKPYDGNEKKLGHISLKNDSGILDEDFDGEIMIDDLYALDSDAVYLYLFPADNEDTAAYDAMFVPHDGTAAAESSKE